MKRVGTFWLIVALIAAMVGCVSVQYDLTISSTQGGEVTTPGEGAFTYAEGSVVSLVATAASGYRFVDWAGDIDTIASPDSATTTITMDGPKSVTANFSTLGCTLTAGSTGGGSVITPGKGTFAYDCGTVVNLLAIPYAGYQFVAWTGDVGTIANVNAATTTIIMHGSYSITANFERKHTPMVAAGVGHTVGLKIDGTVVAVGYNEYGQCDVGNWTDIVQVAAGGEHTVGLKSNGTVVAVGDNEYGQCNVDGWTDIVQVVAGRLHTVGLKSNGTVVAVGDNEYGQCNVGGWTGIIQVAAAANSWHTVGLKSDGAVVAVGGNWEGQCDVGGWTGIIQVAAGGHHTVGLKSDDTVVAVGRNNYGECNVSGWTDIVQVAGACQVTMGIKSDGTVVTVGWNDYGQCNVGGWTNIVQVAGGCGHTIGLKSDGTVVAVGDNSAGQCDVGGWMLS
jgi:uncharacterized repeat protein (TIGR02543 family)